MLNKEKIKKLIDSFKNYNILVIGDLMIDKYLLGSVHRVSPEAPVPVVNVKSESFALGGAGNVALNLASLGVRTEIIGVFGDDATGENIEFLLNENKIAFSKKLIKTGVATITKTRVMAQNQQICRIDWEEDVGKYLLTENILKYIEQKLSSFDAVILSDYAKGVVTQSLVNSCRTLARQDKIFIAIDPKPKRVLNIHGFNLITPNRGEAIEIAEAKNQVNGRYEMDCVCDAIHKKYHPDHLAITLSEDGILYSSKDGDRRIYPTITREVADVSGAGDTVIATLTTAFTAGASAEEAVQLANLAAGVVVSKVGTATVSDQELMDRLK